LQQLPTSKLYAAARTALDKRPRTLTLPAISEQTGLEYRWLKRFRQYKRPCVHRTERLYVFLTGNELVL